MTSPAWSPVCSCFLCTCTIRLWVKAVSAVLASLWSLLCEWMPRSASFPASSSGSNWSCYHPKWYTQFCPILRMPHISSCSPVYWLTFAKYFYTFNHLSNEGAPVSGKVLKNLSFSLFFNQKWRFVSKYVSNRCPTKGSVKAICFKNAKGWSFIKCWNVPLAENNPEGTFRQIKEFRWKPAQCRKTQRLFRAMTFGWDELLILRNRKFVFRHIKSWFKQHQINKLLFRLFQIVSYRSTQGVNHSDICCDPTN